MTSTLVIRLHADSTAFTVSDDANTLNFSIPISASRLTAQELESDPPRAEELSNAIALVQAHLDDVLRELPQITQCERVIGAAHAIQVIGAIERGDAVGTAAPPAFRLTRQAAEDVYRTVATERLTDRVHNPGLPSDQAPTIVAACCIMVSIMRRLHLAEIEIASELVQP